MMSPPAYDVVIPARNEAATIGAVVTAARAANGAGRVIVVDDGSTDGTAGIAADAGAEVVRREGAGDKAQALAAGIAASHADIVVLFDADILRARPLHFEQLAAPLLRGGFAMCCGLIDYGGLKRRLFLRLPPITGLRAIRREVFDAIPVAKLRGFQIEIMINEVIARGRMPTAIMTLPGAGHRSKLRKLGLWRGSRANLAMSLELLHCFTFVPLWTYWSYLRNLTILPQTSISPPRT
jgi:glycosyltransferase involved in cell wall biosynthesis